MSTIVDDAAPAMHKTVKGISASGGLNGRLFDGLTLMFADGSHLSITATWHSGEEQAYLDATFYDANGDAVEPIEEGET